MTRLSLGSDRPGEAALCVDIEIMSRTVVVCGVHLRSPEPDLDADSHGGYRLTSLAALTIREIFSDATPRAIASRKLLDWLKGRAWDAVIVGGDLNTIQIATALRTLYSEFDDVLAHRLAYFRGTKLSNRGLPIQPRIDYLLHSERIAVVHAEVLDLPLGDHRPVTAELAFCGK